MFMIDVSIISILMRFSLLHGVAITILLLDTSNDAFGVDYKKRRGRRLSQDPEHRRLLTNSRERIRQRTLNIAFQSLRNIVPTYPREAKLSKYAVLKAAIKYINFLDDVKSAMEKEIERKMEAS